MNNRIVLSRNCAAATVTETALKLGFSDTTAFTHACQRWFGCAPRELRARLRAAPRSLV